MKKILYFFTLSLCAIALSSCFNEVEADGALSAKFPVSNGKYVQFSKGNLIYNDSSKVWSFTDHQYEVGDSTVTRYFDYSKATLNGKKGNWRCLTADEWDYLLSKSKHALATVNGVPGLLIAGQGFSFGKLKITWNTAEYSINVISAADWESVQKGGVVFLPADGYVNADGEQGPGEMGTYWTTTPFSVEGVSGQYALVFSEQSLDGTNIFPQWPVTSSNLGSFKASIRMVKDAESSNPLSGITDMTGGLGY